MKRAVPSSSEQSGVDAHVARLMQTRQHTRATINGVSAADLERVHSTLLSPIVWDLAHIGAFADLWLAEVLDQPLMREDLAVTYDAGATPRAGRGALELLDLGGARAYLEEVDDALYAALPTLDLSPDSPNPLLRNGFLVDLLVEHEEQHRETILQTLHLAEPGVLAAGPTAAWAPATPPGPVMVSIPGGRAKLGLASGFGYDNEQPQYTAAYADFKIDRTPVTVGAFRAFIEDGGYARQALWEPDGWAWRVAEQIERPMFWAPDGTIRRFDRIEQQDASQPVMNVSWFEADAYARWRGARLPTEVEWEVAARLDPSDGISRLQPWGADPAATPHANLDGNTLGPLPASAQSASPTGVLGLIGDVWEWTSSPLLAYPGFEAFPYPEYSEVFFDGPYRVLRGGSWATGSSVARATFRNWDFPQRRQIFAGLRCAEDV